MIFPLLCLSSFIPRFFLYNLLNSYTFYKLDFYLFYNQNITKSQQVVGEFKSGDKPNLQQAAGRFEKTSNLHQVGGEFPQTLFLIPWGHHIQIFTKCKNVTEAIFYINKTI